MNKQELLDELRRKRIRPYFYDLEGEGGEGALSLTRQGDHWMVFFTERGKKYFDFGAFDTEDAACRRLLEILLAEPSTREDYVPPVPFVPRYDIP